MVIILLGAKSYFINVPSSNLLFFYLKVQICNFVNCLKMAALFGCMLLPIIYLLLVLITSLKFSPWHHFVCVEAVEGKLWLQFLWWAVSYWRYLKYIIIFTYFIFAIEGIITYLHSYLTTVLVYLWFNHFSALIWNLYFQIFFIVPVIYCNIWFSVTLINITRLSLSHNKIATVPAALAHLTNLEILNLANNHIQVW